MRAVTAWLQSGGELRLFGYAGTGKSTLARLIADNAPGGAWVFQINARDFSYEIPLSAGSK